MLGFKPFCFSYTLFFIYSFSIGLIGTAAVSGIGAAGINLHLIAFYKIKGALLEFKYRPSHGNDWQFYYILIFLIIIFRDGRSQQRRRSRNQSSSSEPGNTTGCKEPCVKCLVTVTSLRWVLLVLSMLGVLFVVAGIVMAALHAVGQDFLIYALVFIG